MAKRRRVRRTKKAAGFSSLMGNCKKLRATTSGKFDKVKIGARYYRAKGKAMDVDPKNSRVTVCKVGRGHKMVTSTGALEALRKVPKRR